jgi:hypothetical protein
MWKLRTERSLASVPQLVEIVWSLDPSHLEMDCGGEKEGDQQRG